MFGYDEQKYLEALKEISVVSEEKLKGVTSFLGEMAKVISDMGYSNLFLREEAKLLEKEITERKKAEEALQTSEEKFRYLFDQAADLIAIIDFQGNFLDLNRRFEEESGWSREEMIGKNVFTSGIVTEESARNMSFYLNQMIQDKEIPIFEIEGVRKDGRIVPYELRAAFIRTDKKTVTIQAILRNITERKHAEEVLRESEEKLQSIFRVAPTGIGVVKDRILLEVNPLICEMTGYAKEELVGKSARILYPTQNDFEYVGTEKYRQISERGTGIVETKWMKKDGNIIDVLLASTPIDLHDLSKGVTFTALDITERKKAESEIQERVKELEDFYNIAVGRELKIIELKKKMEELKEELSKYKNR
jgi:PAS domain S-box-containing protein